MEEIKDGLKRCQNLMKMAEARAIKQIVDGGYSSAMLALAEAMQYKAIIDELQFQLDCMEVQQCAEE